MTKTITRSELYKIVQDYTRPTTRSEHNSTFSLSLFFCFQLRHPLLHHLLFFFFSSMDRSTRRNRRSNGRSSRRQRRSHIPRNFLSDNFDRLANGQPLRQRSVSRDGNSPRNVILRAVDSSELPRQQQRLQHQHRHLPQRVLGPREDLWGIYLGPRFELFSQIYVGEQSHDGRWDMVKSLRSLGFLDAEAYPTVRDFVESLPHLYVRTDLMFVMDQSTEARSGRQQTTPPKIRMKENTWMTVRHYNKNK